MTSTILNPTITARGEKKHEKTFTDRLSSEAPGRATTTRVIRFSASTIAAASFHKRVTPEKPSLAVANRPHELSEEAATRLREIANGTSTIKIELMAAPLWERRLTR